MFPSWRNFGGWQVLEFFLEFGQKIHVNGLAKKLKISTSTANKYLVEYEKSGILEKEKNANAIMYRLKENVAVFELKKLLFLSKIESHVEKFLQENQSVSTLVLYGSHAKGTYDSQSDIDLLAISQQKKLILKSLNELEEKTEKRAALQVFTRTEWKNMLQKKDDFAQATIRQNVLLFGEPL